MYIEEHLAAAISGIDDDLLLLKIMAINECKRLDRMQE